MINPKIMIVEDEIIIAVSLRRKLVNAGYKVCELVDTGEKAIEGMKEEEPDIILMDILLKGVMNGIEAAREIRAIRNIPIIFMTGYESERTMQKAKTVKPAGCLIKPVSWETLKASVDMVIQRRE